MERNYTIYKHITPNNKIYIGITSMKVIRRWNNGHGYRCNEHFNRAIKKYGWKNIQHEILFTNFTKEEAEAKEIELIAFYKSNQRKYGYNIENGGKVHKVSEETKEKIRRANIGKKLTEEMNYKLQKGHKEKCKKPIICIETNEVFESAKEVGEKYNVSGTNVTACCRGRQKTVKKLHFKYWLK